MEDIIPLFIPIIALIIPIVAIWTTHKRKLVQMQIDAQQGVASEVTHKVQALEDRVRVLERIVTDKGSDLSAQIEALRDGERVQERLPARDTVN
jgi:hypothetical protein